MFHVRTNFSWHLSHDDAIAMILPRRRDCRAFRSAFFPLRCRSEACPRRDEALWCEGSVGAVVYARGVGVDDEDTPDEHSVFRREARVVHAE